MKITNLDNLLPLLTKEITTGGTMTAPLKVIISEKDHVVVASSVDHDLSMKLCGVTGIGVGSMIAVDTSTGEVKILEDVAPSASSTRSISPRSGCNDKSLLSR